MFYLNGAVVLAGRMTAHVAGVAAARAAFHLHTGRPYQEVGRRGIHLAPGDLVDHRPRLTHRWHRLLYCKKDKEREELSKCVWSARAFSDTFPRMRAHADCIVLIRLFAHVAASCIPSLLII